MISFTGTAERVETELDYQNDMRPSSDLLDQAGFDLICKSDSVVCAHSTILLSS